MVSGCGKQNIAQTEENTTKNNSSEYQPPPAANCTVFTFMEGVSGISHPVLTNIIPDTTYIIKGIVLGKIESYGLSIKFVEDLKGTFPENIDTFTVWGAGGISASNRSDYINIYDEKDTLILHLVPVNEYLLKRYLQHPNPEWVWVEKPNDYTTLDCIKSVLKLSEGYVEGCLFPPNDGIHEYIIQKMLLADFLKELNESLIK